jgi:hypothetical protein
MLPPIGVATGGGLGTTAHTLKHGGSSKIERSIFESTYLKPHEQSLRKRSLSVEIPGTDGPDGKKILAKKAKKDRSNVSVSILGADAMGGGGGGAGGGKSSMNRGRKGGSQNRMQSQSVDFGQMGNQNQSTDTNNSGGQMASTFSLPTILNSPRRKRRKLYRCAGVSMWSKMKVGREIIISN